MRGPSKKTNWLHMGATIAVVLIVGAGVAVTILGGRIANEPAESDVLLILALPGEDDIVLPRTIDRHQFQSGTMEIQSLDPMSTVTIPGTGLNLLRDVYPFEGPAGLAESISSDSPHPAHVVLDSQDLGALTAEGKLTVHLTTQIDVFDGEQMFTFPQGPMPLDAQQITAMLKGVEYLEAADRVPIIEGLGREVARTLGIVGIPHSEVDTDLSPDEYQRWLAKLEAYR
ncbi:MAG: hypothetical protein M1617_06280 [Actinobacteria bacterium]|nr:hypothetical protein [Actinomycetota bacterium]